MSRLRRETATAVEQATWYCRIQSAHAFFFTKAERDAHEEGCS